MSADTVASALKSLMGRGWQESSRFQLGFVVCCSFSGRGTLAESGMRSSGFILGMTMRGEGSFWSDAFRSHIDGMRTGDDDSETCRIQSEMR